jgi:hypothetical protein
MKKITLIAMLACLSEIEAMDHATLVPTGDVAIFKETAGTVSENLIKTENVVTDAPDGSVDIDGSIKAHSAVVMSTLGETEAAEPVDSGVPVKELRKVTYQCWVQSGYWKRGCVLGGTGGSQWVDTSHYETRYREEFVTIDHKSHT